MPEQFANPGPTKMIFQELPLAGAFLILPERVEDERGYFSRTFCRDTFVRRGLEDCSLQCSVSYNKLAGTLRGLHFQRAPYYETKLVRCSRGRIFDVIVDLRSSSLSFGKWHGAELTEVNGHELYIPRGFAHGFITLKDSTEIIYQISNQYVPEAAAGVRWDDSDIGIRWPIMPKVMSDVDRILPRLKQAALG